MRDDNCLRTGNRYLDNPNVGTAKVPSILYYDKNGNFRGVENGTGLQDDESLIQMRWSVVYKYPPSSSLLIVTGGS